MCIECMNVYCDVCVYPHFCPSVHLIFSISSPILFLESCCFTWLYDVPDHSAVKRIVTVINIRPGNMYRFNDLLSLLSTLGVHWSSLFSQSCQCSVLSVFVLAVIWQENHGVLSGKGGLFLLWSTYPCFAVWDKSIQTPFSTIGLFYHVLIYFQNFSFYILYINFFDHSSWSLVFFFF